MTGFSLDTSGVVSGYVQSAHITDRNSKVAFRKVWRNLSPFAQGYVEAALHGPIHAPPLPDNPATWVAPPRFSDLAPATLAAMLKDCEHYERLKTIKVHPGGGGAFWRGRQNGTWLKNFPPLTLYLGDDGLIYQREAAS